MNNITNTTLLSIAFLLPFFITILSCRILIPVLQKFKFGQFIREEGPKSHQSKSGTPTMGGVTFLLAILVSTLIYVAITKKMVLLPPLGMTIGFGIVGFLDDFIKIKKKRNLGLTEIQKLGLQGIITAAFAVYVVKYVGTDILIPFFHNKSVHMPIWLFIPFLFFAVLGTVNGTNLTDGLDGLNTSVTMVVSGFFIVISILFPSMFEKQLSVSATIVLGALTGFLLFNVFPARVFMGDTGSLALGGFVSAFAFMNRIPLFILIFGFIYLAEVISDIIQVTYFKYTKKKYGEGRRVFKMAPLHHHFQESGYAETQVVAAFSIATLVCCIIALIAV